MQPKEPGPVACSVVMPLGMQEAPQWILASGTFSREDWVISMAILPLLLIQEEKLSDNSKIMYA